MLIEELQQLHQRNRTIATVFVVFIFVVLGLRVFELQLIRTSKFLQRAEENRIREVIIEPSRGLMYDRHGELLVDTRPAFSVWVVPYEVNKSEDVIPLLGKTLEMPVETMKDRFAEMGRGFNVQKLAGQISFKQLSLLEENRLDLPGVIYRTEPMRYYIHKMRASHILGYIGEINQNEIEKYSMYRYRSGDIIGKGGIEQRYEQYLRGQKGYRYLQVDAEGREIGQVVDEKKDIPPYKGADLLLTLDRTLQEKIEALMEDKKGAAVFLDPNNGEVLAMTSKPDFDPNLFAGQISSADWNRLLNHPDKPLLNRATMGGYPAGSTLKLAAALAALNDGKITPQWRRSCYGQYRLGRRIYHCFRGTAHGQLNLRQAIERSCNVYFYQLGLEIGHDCWARYCSFLHFGEKTGIDIPEEIAGLVPDKAYMDKTYGEGGWTDGYLLNMVIGQGDNLVTPCQMARYAGIMATSGKMCTPHLVRAVENVDTGQWNYLPIDSVQISEIADESFSVIREGMRRVVQGEKGTARGSRLTSIEYAGKTGTAENPHGDDHGWFIGFAPYDNPQIAFAVIVEHGGTGGGSAAPIAREVLRVFFNRQPAAIQVTMHDD